MERSVFKINDNSSDCLKLLADDSVLESEVLNKNSKNTRLSATVTTASINKKLTNPVMSNNTLSEEDLSSSSSAVSTNSAQSMSRLLNELNELKEKEKMFLEKEKMYMERIDSLEEENDKFKTVAIDFEDIFRNLVKDKEESEIKLKNEIIELTKERDHLQEDVIGVERAFDDLHRRFEKLKTKVEEFKKVTF